MGNKSGMSREAEKALEGKEKKFLVFMCILIDRDNLKLETNIIYVLYMLL